MRPFATREEVVRFVLAAQRPEDIEEAKRLIREWIRNRPQDVDYMRSAGESLRMLEGR